MPGHLLLCSVAAALRDSLVPWRGCEEFSVARAVAWEGMEFGETGPFVLRVLSDSSPVRRDRGRAASEEAGPTPPGFGPVSAPHALPGRRPPRASCFAEAGSLPPSVSYFSGGLSAFLSMGVSALSNLLCPLKGSAHVLWLWLLSGRWPPDGLSSLFTPRQPRLLCCSDGAADPPLVFPPGRRLLPTAGRSRPSPSLKTGPPCFTGPTSSCPHPPRAS